MTEVAGFDRSGAGRRHRFLWAQIGLLAAVAYLLPLRSSPGRMPTDTKLYLYLNPARLLADAPWMWDTRQFAGWVPHQAIGYLWPMGPWFWVMDRLGVPDWIAHRLWIGTLLFAASTGMRWCARRLGLSPMAALAAAFVYGLSPYILPYVARTSGQLPNWAALGWITGLTVVAMARAAETADHTSGPGLARAAGPADDTGGPENCRGAAEPVVDYGAPVVRRRRERARRWREPALIALLVATISGLNATAILLIAPAPALWLLDTGLRRAVQWRRIVGFLWRTGVLCVGATAWWVGGLVVQGRYGADVLSFTETLDAVSFTAAGSEVLRGLGYWLTYVGDRAGPLTQAGLWYQVSLKSVVTTFAIVLVAIAGLLLVRWQARRFAAWTILSGLVIGVGVHPISHASPLFRAFADNPGSGLALALRSSTRAVPCMLIGLALGAGALAERWRLAVLDRGTRPRPMAAVVRAAPARLRRSPSVVAGLGSFAIIGLAFVNLPGLWRGELVSVAQSRQEAVPAAWSDAAAALDRLPTGYGVLQVPGSEFGAHRWGLLVDPLLPAITNRPIVTRDLVPSGSPAAMDLLYALDDRLQDGTLDVTAVAPIARLLGADQILLPGDLAYERFRVRRPSLVAGMLDTAPASDLGTPATYGDTVPSLAADAYTDGTNDIAGARTPPPTVTVWPVAQPVPVVRAKTRSVVVVGSGAGLVDAAGAGLITGSELIRYAASLDDDGLASAATDASMVIVTDSNRRQAHEWRGSRDVTGFTEDGAGEQVLTADLADHRLAVFAPIRPADQTTARQDGPIRAVASGYGDPTTYRPEDRADQAIDGNLATAWRVGDRAEVLGERLRLDLATPTTAASAITVVQPQRGDRSRWITSVRVTTAAGSVEALLDESSRSASGQHIVLPPGSTPRIEIEVTGTNVARQRSYRGWGPVGFAEVRVDGTPPTEEVVSLPTRVPAVADGHLTVVLTRLRADPHDRWRSDPEPTLVRDVTLASTATLSPQTALRLNPSVDDATLDRLLGLDPALAATSRLPGSPDHAAWAAVDGDPTTSWISAPDPAPGVSITLPQPPQPPVPNPVGPELRHFDIHFLADEFHSRPTHLTLLTGGRAQPVEIPAVVDGGTDVVGVDLDAPLVGSLTIRVDDFTPAWSSDSRTGEETALPIGIAEITGLTQTLPATIPSTCEAGALQIDGKPIGLRPTIAGTTLTAWLSGTEVPAVPCEPGPITLAKGVHQVAGTSGSDAWNLDRVVLGPPSAVNRPVGAASTSDAGLPASTALPATKVVATSRTGRTVEVGPCPSGCWLVLGEGWNRGWVAKLRGGDGLGTPQVVDGGFNGWWIEPSSDVRTVEMTWTPQRTIWFGFTLTLFTLALSVVILVGARSRAGLGVGRQTSPSTDVTVSGSMPVAAVSPAPIDRRRRRWSGVVGAGVLGSLVLSGRWGAMAALIVAVATLIRRRHLVGWLAFAIVAAIACWYGWRIHQLRPFPGYGWVVNIEAAHPWAILAIVLLAVALSDRSQT